MMSSRVRMVQPAAVMDTLSACVSWSTEILIEPHELQHMNEVGNSVLKEVGIVLNALFLMNPGCLLPVLSSHPKSLLKGKNPDSELFCMWKTGYVIPVSDIHHCPLWVYYKFSELLCILFKDIWVSWKHLYAFLISFFNSFNWSCVLSHTVKFHLLSVGFYISQLRWASLSSDKKQHGEHLSFVSWVMRPHR